MNHFIHLWYDNLGSPVHGRPMWVDDDGSVLLGRDDGGISHYNPTSKTVKSIVASPYGIGKRLISFNHLSARLFRMVPRCFLRLSSGSLLWVAGKSLWRYDPARGYSVSTYNFKVGSGPLFLAQSPDGKIFFGDYIATRDRQPSHVRVSCDDGQTWQILYRFPMSRIRHVHGVFWDPFAGCIVLTTGDADHEAGIWILDGDVPKVLAGGRSLYRVVQPVFTADSIIFGTDTPGEDCAIYKMSRNNCRVELLHPTRGPVFFGAAFDKYFAFTTVVEPGHLEQSAALYVGDTLGKFKEVLVLPKDRYNMQLFQYGQIYLPANESKSDQLWFTACATKNDHHLCSCKIV